MKRIIQIALLLGCVLGIEMGQAAYAAQFNVTAPVNLSNISSQYNAVVVKGFILCGQGGGSEGRGGFGDDPWTMQVGEQAFGQRIVGISQQIRPIDTGTGEFHSSVSLSLNVAQGFYPNNVGNYIYFFKLQGPNVADFIPSSSVVGTDFRGTQGTAHYLGSFNNPAIAGSQCDDEDFNQ
jgi:hypothetical protein